VKLVHKVSFLFLLVLPCIALAGVAPDPLYQALLGVHFTNLPAGLTAADVSAARLTEQAKEAGITGEVDIRFKGDDSKAKCAYFVFKDFDAASEFNRKFLPKVIPGQKLLAYPPFARCVESPGAGGYCDMWVQDEGVILSCTAAKVDNDAATLMSLGFKNLSTVYENLSRQASAPPSPKAVGTCSLLTHEEIQSALNEQVSEPEPDRVGGCSWRGRGEDALTIQENNTGRSGFDNAKARSAGTQAISGIGDEAFGFVSLAGFVQIQFIHHNRFIAFTLQSSNPSKFEIAKSLAAKIASRL